MSLSKLIIFSAIVLSGFLLWPEFSRAEDYPCCIYMVDGIEKCGYLGMIKQALSPEAICNPNLTEENFCKQYIYQSGVLACKSDSGNYYEKGLAVKKVSCIEETKCFDKLPSFNYENIDWNVSDLSIEKAESQTFNFNASPSDKSKMILNVFCAGCNSGVSFILGSNGNFSLKLDGNLLPITGKHVTIFGILSDKSSSSKEIKIAIKAPAPIDEEAGQLGCYCKIAGATNRSIIAGMLEKDCKTDSSFSYNGQNLSNCIWNASGSQEIEKDKEPPTILDVSGLNKLGTTDVRILIGRMIKGAMGITGSIAFVMFIYGGISWMTAMGKAEKQKTGFNTIVWSSLGIIIILASYGILNYVLQIFE